jgi:hypothetical protein
MTFAGFPPTSVLEGTFPVTTEPAATDRAPLFSTPVEKYFELRLTGPVKRCVLFKVNCRAQNPSAEMRGGFLR